MVAVGALSMKHVEQAEVMRDAIERLADEIKEAGLNSDHIIDKDGSTVLALEKAEAYYKNGEAVLRDMIRRAVGAPDDALQQLDSLMKGCRAMAASLQEVRWMVMVTDGTQGPPPDEQSPRYTTGKDLMRAILDADLD